jgi:hypothetical protein
MESILRECKLCTEDCTLLEEYDYSSHFKKVCKIPINCCPNQCFFKSIEKCSIGVPNPGSYLTLFKKPTVRFDNADCPHVSSNETRVS